MKGCGYRTLLTARRILHSAMAGFQTWYHYVYHLPYLFGYKTGLSLSRMSTNNQISPMQFCCNKGFTLPNNPKDLDPSDKTDLDFWDCFGRKNTLSYKRRNTVTISQHLAHCAI